MTHTRSPHILVADDDQFLRDLLKDFFNKSDCTTTLATDGQRAMAACQTETFDIALVDLKLPDQNGVDLLTELRQLDPTLPIIIMTGYPTIESSIEALRHGANDFVVKPFRLQDLKERIDRAIRTRTLTRDIDDLRARLAAVEEELRTYRSSHAPSFQ